MSSTKKRAVRRWILGAVFLAVLFTSGITAGYLFFMRGVSVQPENKTGVRPVGGDFIYLRVYYPFEGRLQMEERRVPRVASRVSVAEATIREFLKGPAGVAKSCVPEGAELIGVYPGQDGMLYIDFSGELRRNFQGGALSEFLLLRGLYESLLSNYYGAGGFKILVEGREVESIGGHISLLRTLGEVVSQTVEEDESQ